MTPALVTVRVRSGIPSLRARAMVDALRNTFSAASEGKGFRLLHYSIQSDHIHMLVEAQDQTALGRGMNSISARIARAVNRGFGRAGQALAGRYHARLLKTPREVRNALRYVLSNLRKHTQQRTGALPPAAIDKASSGQWFDGWKNAGTTAQGTTHGTTRGRGPRGVARPVTWLVRVGWRRHGPIDLREVPGSG